MWKVTDQKKTKSPSGPASAKRRKFLRTLVMAGSLVGASLVGILPAVRGWVKKLRPPGALPEGRDSWPRASSAASVFRCVRWRRSSWRTWWTGWGSGTPWIDSRRQACDFSCDGLQCVLACPTGALTHHINYPHEAKMAVAKVVRPRIVSGTAR